MEQSGRVSEMSNLETAKFRTEAANLDSRSGQGVDEICLAAAKFAAKVFFVLVWRMLQPQNFLRPSPTDPPRKFHRVFVQEHLVCHGLLRERFEEVKQETRKMQKSQGREWALVQLQSQEPPPRARGSCMGQSAYSLLGLHLMGIIFRCPLRADQAM